MTATTRKASPIPKTSNTGPASATPSSTNRGQASGVAQPPTTDDSPTGAGLEAEPEAQGAATGSDDSTTEETAAAPSDLAFVDEDPGSGSGVGPVWPLTVVFLVSMVGAWQCTRPSRLQ